MIVTVVMTGSVEDVELADGSTVVDLIRAIELDVDVDDELGIYLNNREIYWKHALKDGDSIIIAWPIHGAAPLPRGRRRHAVEFLRDFAKGAQELIILDPYATVARHQSPSSYAGEFVDCLNLEGGSNQSIRLIDSPQHHDPDILRRIATACGERGCNVVHKYTTSIHDRFWIKDRTEVLALGTSFNSMGRKLAFALNMPASDRDYLLDFLRRNQLI